MYCLFKMVTFQLAMLVYQRVQRKEQRAERSASEHHPADHPRVLDGELLPPTKAYQWHKNIYSTKNRHQSTSGFSVFWVSGPSILRHSRLSQLASNNRYGRGLRLRHMLRLGGVFSLCPEIARSWDVGLALHHVIHLLDSWTLPLG